MEALTAAEQNAQSLVSKALQAAKVYKYMPLGPVYEHITAMFSSLPPVISIHKCTYRDTIP